MQEIRPVRSRLNIGNPPSVSAERISRCREHLGAWCATATSKTERERIIDLRRFGRWQWGEDRPGVIVAWLLHMPTEDAAELIAAFDRIEARTASRLVRKRRLHHIRGALKFAAARDGTDAPIIAPAVKDAA